MSSRDCDRQKAGAQVLQPATDHFGPSVVPLMRAPQSHTDRFIVSLIVLSQRNDESWNPSTAGTRIGTVTKSLRPLNSSGKASQDHRRTLTRRRCGENKQASKGRMSRRNSPCPEVNQNNIYESFHIRPQQFQVPACESPRCRESRYNPADRNAGRILGAAGRLQWPDQSCSEHKGSCWWGQARNGKFRVREQRAMGGDSLFLEER